MISAVLFGHDGTLVDAEPASLQRVKQEAARAYLSQSAFPLMPGAREAVRTLAARGVRMAVVTAWLAFAVWLYPPP